jgi:tetraacyldisaccharide 4'-kinase
MADLAHYFKELVSGERRGGRDRLLLALLRLASHPYALVLRLRALGYRLGLLRSYRLPCPVISVGNLTLGGTGKTPMVARLATEMIGRGRRVAVLSRGYGGTANGELRIVSDGSRILLSAEESGDEPYLLARKVPGLMVVIGADRYRAGLLALGELKPDIFILDDGFQHLRLHRDLNLLLLDASNPFATGATLPAGLLREPRSAAGRADLVIYTRSSEGGKRPDLFPGKHCLWTKHHLSGILPLAGGGGGLCPFESLQTSRVLAFSGIADPESFFASLEARGVGVVTTIAFPDHSRYGEAEIAAILRLKKASGSTVLVTTEKDAVKLLPHAERLGACYAAVMEILFEDARPLEIALEKLIS